MNNIVSLEALSVGYVHGKAKNIILESVSGNAEKGELVAVIGRNGIGKSTLLRTMAGIQKPVGGKIFYSGKDSNEYSRNELAKMAGYISTETVKTGNMSVFDLVSLGRFPYTGWMGNLTPADSEAINSAIETTSVSPLRHRYVSELSDGERQKAMIARVLAQDTSIMLMDEPTSFLDIGARSEIFHLLHRLAREAGKTIMFTTHDLDTAIRNCDRIWLINEGKISEGSPEDLMLEGKFGQLFASATVKFDNSTGSFSLPDENHGSVFIEGEGLLLNWTEKAVRRAGFTISSSRKIPSIEILPKDKKWRITIPGQEILCNSLYEVVKSISAIY